MCENDQAVDAWFAALRKRANSRDLGRTLHFQVGTLRGTIRELAATVPGVREWLIAHMPEGE